MVEIRDPIHGAIRVSEQERVVVEHPFVQRLRNIRACGFSHLPFPGATHTRYAHSLGVMYLAGRAFESAYRNWTFSSPSARDRFRAAVRLGALLHDLGHAPLSHCAEFAMPPLERLEVYWYGAQAAEARRATHEDYSIAILAHSSLGDAISSNFEFVAQHVAALISLQVPDPDGFFIDGGLDHRRILSQIISSELDVDRLDYLARDSYYTGARYGQIDAPWLLSHMCTHVTGNEVSLALDLDAIYAFDDFLIARHHMFLMVYFHHKSVIYEELLKRYVTESDGAWDLPADVESYRHWDDITLDQHLRRSSNEWARRVVERRPYRRVVERHGRPFEVDLTREEAILRSAGMDVIHTNSTGRISHYHTTDHADAPCIFVVDRNAGIPERVMRLSDATHIFERYDEAHRLARLYVAPEDRDRARSLLHAG